MFVLKRCALLLLVANRLQAEPVEPRIAYLILEDSRLTSFVGLLNQNYSVNCTLPVVDAFDATKVCNGTGDFASCYYSFNRVCAEGLNAPQGISVTAEYFPLGNFILDLSINTFFRK